jgi:hypothetical protein
MAGPATALPAVLTGLRGRRRLLLATLDALKTQNLVTGTHLILLGFFLCHFLPVSGQNRDNSIGYVIT